MEKERDALIRQRAEAYRNHPDQSARDQQTLQELKTLREQKIATPEQEGNPYGLSDRVLERNKILGYEVVLSIGRHDWRTQLRSLRKLDKAFQTAMTIGEDLDDPSVRNKIFEVAGFRVEYRSYDEETETISYFASYAGVVVMDVVLHKVQ